MKKKIYLFLVILSVLSCNDKKQSVRLEDQALYQINLDSIPIDESTFLASSMFKKVRTIILENHEFAVVGSIDAMQVFENNIFIMDKYKAKKLFVFDRNGKYLRQIGSLGQGPGEYVFLSDFCINTQKREIYLLDSNTCKALKYNLDTGKYIDSFTFKANKSCSYLTFFNDKLYTAIIPNDSENPGNLILEMDLATGENKEYLDADIHNSGWNRREFTPYSFFFAKLNNSQRFVEHYMNTFMSVDKTGIHPYLSVTKKNWVQKSDILSKKELEELRMDMYFKLENQKKAWFLKPNYVESDNYICFQYFDPPMYYCVFFDKNTQTAKVKNWLQNDLRDGIAGPSTMFMFYDSRFAYEYFPDMSYFYEYIKKELAIGLDKREELLKLNDEETMVIFEYEFK